MLGRSIVNESWRQSVYACHGPEGDEARLISIEGSLSDFIMAFHSLSVMKC